MNLPMATRDRPASVSGITADRAGMIPITTGAITAPLSYRRVTRTGRDIDRLVAGHLVPDRQAGRPHDPCPPDRDRNRGEVAAGEAGDRARLLRVSLPGTARPSG